LGEKFLPSLPRHIQCPTVSKNRYKVKAAEISRHILTLPKDDYCSENTKLVAVREFRIIFQNILEEQDSCTVSYSIVPMRKEIDSMFFHVMLQHQKEAILGMVPSTALTYNILYTLNLTRSTLRRNTTQEREGAKTESSISDR